METNSISNRSAPISGFAAPSFDQNRPIAQTGRTAVDISTASTSTAQTAEELVKVLEQLLKPLLAALSTVGEVISNAVLGRESGKDMEQPGSSDNPPEKIGPDASTSPSDPLGSIREKIENIFAEISKTVSELQQVIGPVSDLSKSANEGIKKIVDGLKQAFDSYGDILLNLSTLLPVGRVAKGFKKFGKTLGKLAKKLL